MTVSPLLPKVTADITDMYIVDLAVREVDLEVRHTRSDGAAAPALVTLIHFCSHSPTATIRGRSAGGPSTTSSFCRGCSQTMEP